MKKFLIAAAMCFLSLYAIAQTPVDNNAGAPRNSLSNGAQLKAELTKSLDAKKAKTGDEITAKLTQDVKVNGNVVLQKGSKLVGHVTEAQARTKEGESKLGVVFDKAISKNGQEMAFNGVIISFSAPVDSQTTALGGSNMDRGSGPNNGGRGIAATPMGGAANSTAGPVRDGYGTVPTATAPDTGSDATGNATPGLNGMEGVAMTATPAGAIFHSPSRNIKLDNNAQIVVQVVNQPAAR